MRIPLILPSLALLCTQPVIPEAIPRVAVTVSTHAQGTDLWVVYALSATGNPDSLVVTTNPGAVRRKYLSSTKDSVKYARPAPSLTLSGSVAAIAVRRNLVSPTVSKPWSYTEPDVPPPAPTVDSLIVRPASLLLGAGETKQFCTIYKLSNGETGLVRSNSTATPTIWVEQDTMLICRDMLAAYRMGL